MRRQIICLLFLCLIMHTSVQAEDTPIVRMQLDKRAAAPGETLTLQITVLAPTWFTQAPNFPSFETSSLIVRLPPNSTWATSEDINGKSWSGVTREYQLFPMIVGKFRLAKKPIALTYAHPESREPVSVNLYTEEITFEGQIPKGAKQLKPFIAAESLSIARKASDTQSVRVRYSH